MQRILMRFFYRFIYLFSTKNMHKVIQEEGLYVKYMRNISPLHRCEAGAVSLVNKK